MHFNHRKVIFNNISNTVAMFTSMAIALVMTPIYIKYLGLNLFGIWHIVVSITSYISLMDLGMQSAIQKYVAQYHGVENRDKIVEVILSSLIFYGSVAFIGFAIIIIIIIAGMQYFNIDQQYFVTTKILILIMGISTLLSFPGSVFTGVLTGMQLFYVVNAAIIIMNVIMAVSIYIALKCGYGLLAMAMIGFMGNFTLQIILLSVATWKYNVFKNANMNISISSLKEMIGFGTKTFMIVMTSRIRMGSDALIIGHFMTADWIPYYIAPVNLIYYARNIIQLITQAFLPVFSNLEARKDDNTARNIFLTYSRYSLVFILPIIIFVMLYGTPFIKIWLGDVFADIGGQLTLLLSFSLILSSIYPLSIMFLIGTSRQNTMIYAGIAAACIFVFLSIIMIQSNGLLGLATAFFVSEIIPCVFILRKALSIFKITIKEYWSDSIRIAMFNGLLMGLFIWVMKGLVYPNDYICLSIQCAVSIIFYVSTSYLVVLTENEKEDIINYASSIRNRMYAYMMK